MVDQGRVEAFVVQVGVARGLISQAQLQAAQSRSGGSLLARLNPQLTPESRSVLQALYHQALASEQAASVRPVPGSGTFAGDKTAPPRAPGLRAGPGSGTFSAEKTQAPSGPREGGFHGTETYMSGVVPARVLLGDSGAIPDETYLGAPPPEETHLGSRGSASVAERTESGRVLAADETYAARLSGAGEDALDLNETYASFAGDPTRTDGSGISIEIPPSENVTRALKPGSGSGAPVRVTGPAASARTVALPDETAQARPAAKPPAGPAPKVGDRIGAYETLRELGRGGMGIVYEARDTRSGDQVALKLMIVTRKTTEDDVARFKIEAKAALKLDHPNLVRVFEQGVSDEGHWFTAMEFVPGEDLDAKMKREGVLDSEDAAEITLDLADALAYAHEQSILHRDIKPQNVMIDAEGVPRLTDFGLAKLRDDDAKTSLTASGTLLGTPAYMSPEQATGEKRDVDERTDVYCLGATLYHMLTGKPPFERPSLTSLLLAITTEKPVPPTELVDDVDRDLETIVLKCLEKDRAARYQSMRALARDLNRWTKALDIVAKRPSPVQNFVTWAQANRPLVAVSSGAAVVVLATLAFAFSRGPAAPQLAGSPSPAATPGEEPAKTEEAPAKTEAPPAKTEEPPAKTEEPPPAKTEEPPPAKTEEPPPAKTVDPPPTKTEEPPPAKTEEPPAKTVDPPPTKTEDPPSGSAKVLPAGAPPAWLVRRLDHMRERPEVLYVSRWADAVTEAEARKVPILLASLHHTVQRFTPAQLLAEPAQIERVNASCVFVIAQFRHPPAPGERPPGGRPGQGRPGQGPPGQGRPSLRDGRGSPPDKECPYFPMKCADHEAIQSPNVEPPDLQGVQLRIYGSRGQEVLSETPNRKTQHQGNKTFDYSAGPFEQALREARRRTGATLEPADLEGIGLELSRADAERDRRRAEKTYAEHAQRQDLFGSWARFRLRGLCRREIKKAGRDAARLRALRPRFRSDPACLKLIEEEL